MVIFTFNYFFFRFSFSCEKVERERVREQVLVKIVVHSGEALASTLLENLEVMTLDDKSLL